MGNLTQAPLWGGGAFMGGDADTWYGGEPLDEDIGAPWADH